MQKRRPVIALVGNPNAGKTALFNALTGSHQKVGNWPGVTVEKRSGYCQFQGQCYDTIDLPGSYSVSVPSKQSPVDQRIACEYLLSSEADLIVNVIDGSHLERNLYLTLQLLTLGRPIILAVNMMDVVEKQGLRLNLNKLSQVLGCPVLPLVASQRLGVDALKKAIVAKRTRTMPIELPFLPKLKTAIESLSTWLQQAGVDKKLAMGHAQRLLEGDSLLRSSLPASVIDESVRWIQEVKKDTGEEPDILIADARYERINAIVLNVVTVERKRGRSLTERIDRIVLNRYLGIPIFLMVMYGLFVLSINLGGAFQDFFDMSSTAVFVDGVRFFLTKIHTPIYWVALLADGVGRGINTILTFIPVLASLFFFLACLEDSGYMTRAAFVVDRFMQALGLPGKSFVPMMVGFGCNVPAVMGARGLEGHRDRILTILMMPFMSCGARLAIFAVFASAFFPHGGQNLIFMLYLLGIGAAMLTGLLLRKTLLPGKAAPLVMELPPYHRPCFLSMCREAGARLKLFIKRAGRIIIPVCILIGSLNAMTLKGHLVASAAGDSQSVLSQVGRAVTPILSPMGITQDNWPATLGLVTGVLAKEVVIGTLNTLYSQEASAGSRATGVSQWHWGTAIKAALATIPANLLALKAAFSNPWLANASSHDMSPQAYRLLNQRFGGAASALAYLLFILLYFPCVSTMAVIDRELNKAWLMFSLVWNTTLAYAVAVIVYQSLTWWSHPLSASLWILGLLVYWGGVIALMSLRQTKRRAACQDDAVWNERINDPVSH